MLNFNDQVKELYRMTAQLLDELTRIYTCGSIINQIDSAEQDRAEDDGA